MPTTGGINWTFQGPITERWEGGQQTVSFGARVPWDGRVAWRKAMIGYATHTEPDQRLTRVLPYRYPEPDSKLVCTNVESSEGKGVFIETGAVDSEVIEHVYRDPAAGGTPQLEGDAFYRVTCASVLYLVKADADITSEIQRFVTQRVRPSGEAQRIPRNTWSWMVPATGLASGTIYGEDSALPVMITHYAWTLLGIPKLPPLLSAAVGKVNATTFTGPDGTQYQSECLLMEPPGIEPRVGPDLAMTFDLTINVVLRGSSWNRYFAVEDPLAPAGTTGPGFFPLIAKDSSRKPYEPFEFATLFTRWDAPV